MYKRDFIKTIGALSATVVSANAFADDYKFSREKYGYPDYPYWNGDRSTGSPTWNIDKYKVAQFSGAIETYLPYNNIPKSSSPYEIQEKIQKDIKYGGFINKKSLNEYFLKKPITSFTVIKNNKLIYEKFGFDRNATMRMTSWSMAKSVTGILLGACLDKKIIDSLDDVAAKYVPSLSNSYHGSITLRNLSNMSSGADISHAKANEYIYPMAFKNRGSDLTKVVAEWNKSNNKQGQKFNYNELCALTIGMVIRSVTRQSLSEFARHNLWDKLGATSDATWMTDSSSSEFNCIGFNAITRDWVKIGMMIANRGSLNGSQILSENWIREITTWSENDRQVMLPKPAETPVSFPKSGYKSFFWHFREDGSLPMFSGAFGQFLLIDMKSNTVILQTALSDEYEWMNDLLEINEAVGQLNV